MVVIASPGEAEGTTGEVVSGCESVLGAGRCVVARSAADSSGSAPSTYLAEVTWLDPERLAVRVRLFRSSSASTVLFERQIAFLARDGDAQRQRATGVLVAAGVVSSVQTGEREPTPPPLATAERSPEASPRDVPATSKPKRAANGGAPVSTSTYAPATMTVGVDAGPFVGSGLSAKQPEVGLSLRGWWRSRLPWRAIAQLNYAEGPYEPRLTSWILNLAVAARLERLSWIEPKLGLDIGHHAITATESSGRRSETARLFRYGVSVGSDFMWRLARNAAVLTTLEITATLPAYDLWVGGEQVGSAPLLGWRGFLGLRIGPNGTLAR